MHNLLLALRVCDTIVSIGEIVIIVHLWEGRTIMMKNNIFASTHKVVWALLACVSLSGCLASFTYNGVTYPSRATATSAANHYLQSEIARIRPTGKSTDLSITIFIPTRSMIQTESIVYHNTPLSPDSEQVQYLVDISESGLSHIAVALRKLNLFKRVTVDTYQSNETRPTADSADYVLWVKVENQGTEYILSSNGHEETQYLWPNDNLGGVAWFQEFLQELADAAERLPNRINQQRPESK